MLIFFIVNFFPFLKSQVMSVSPPCFKTELLLAVVSWHKTSHLDLDLFLFYVVFNSQGHLAMGGGTSAYLLVKTMHCKPLGIDK